MWRTNHEARICFWSPARQNIFHSPLSVPGGDPALTVASLTQGSVLFQVWHKYETMELIRLILFHGT